MAGPPDAPGPGTLSPLRLHLALAVLAAALAYPLLESRLWSRSLWGAHALAFLPMGWWLVPIGLGVLFVPGVAERIGERLERLALPARVWAPLSGLAAAVVFWLARERHLFWGDALPLSINVPAGQTFHANEPLTLWLHHAIWSWGGGRWGAVSAIAAASAIAGGLWVTLHARGFARTRGNTGIALLATLVIASQGAAGIFHGHVENYAYVAVCFAAFLWSGAGYLDGRAPAWAPFAALVAGYAFHLIGALALPAALSLIWHGLRRPERRTGMLVTLAIATALVAGIAWAARGLYGGAPAFATLVQGVQNVLFQPRDMRAESVFTLRRLADLWSHVVQMGPLSLVVTALLAAILPFGRVTQSASGRFLALAAITLYAPALLVGEGNLGAARNWDLFAAPAMAMALFALRLVLAVEPAAARDRLLLASLAASLALSVPWTVLNMDPVRTGARVAALPLGGGRSAAMLGTAALNAGDLAGAERWFERSLAEDPLNLNALSGLGLSRARAGRLVEAEPLLTQVVRLAPQKPQFRFDLATLYMRTERWASASAEWQAGLPLEPRTPVAWLGLATALDRAGHPDSAAAALLAARNWLPADTSISRALADACARWVASAGQRSDRAEFARAWGVFEAQFPNDPRVIAWRPRAAAMLQGR
jgi:tetratricopeptide (TPR) repeat protein